MTKHRKKGKSFVFRFLFRLFQWNISSVAVAWLRVSDSQVAGKLHEAGLQCPSSIKLAGGSQLQRLAVIATQ